MNSAVCICFLAVVAAAASSAIPKVEREIKGDISIEYNPLPSEEYGFNDVVRKILEILDYWKGVRPRPHPIKCRPIQSAPSYVDHVHPTYTTSKPYGDSETDSYLATDSYKASTTRAYQTTPSYSTHTSTKSSSYATTKPTTYATTKPTTYATTKPTTYATTKPTTYATTKPTTYATTKPTTHATTKPTTYATTKPTTYATTKPTTYATTKPTTYATTKPTTYATTKPTTYATTEPTTYATTKPTTQESTKSFHKRDAAYPLVAIVGHKDVAHLLDSDNLDNLLCALSQVDFNKISIVPKIPSLQDLNKLPILPNLRQAIVSARYRVIHAVANRAANAAEAVQQGVLNAVHSVKPIVALASLIAKVLHAYVDLAIRADIAVKVALIQEGLFLVANIIKSIISYSPVQKILAMMG